MCAQVAQSRTPTLGECKYYNTAASVQISNIVIETVSTVVKCVRTGVQVHTADSATYHLLHLPDHLPVHAHVGAYASRVLPAARCAMPLPLRLHSGFHVACVLCHVLCTQRVVRRSCWASQ